MASRPHLLILDTNILSALLDERHPAHEQAQQMAQSYLAEHARLAFSVVTQYEIERGLMAKGCSRRLLTFKEFCQQCDVLPTPSFADLVPVWVGLTKAGRSPGKEDLDVIIAATALTLSPPAGVVSDDRVFQDAHHALGLYVEDWIDLDRGKRRTLPKRRRLTPER